MEKQNFEELLSGLSHDDLLDRKWVEVPTTADQREKYGSSQAPIGSLVDTLQELYWSGVQREVASVILAFDEIQSLHPEETEEEQREREEATGLLLDKEKDQVINEWLRIWTPFEDIRPGEADAWTIKHAVASFLKEPLPKRRARSLLQACGFLDIDFCREYRPPSFRSWGQRPHAHDRSNGYKRVFVAVQCSQCRNCIRSLSYYTCVKGCKDSTVLRNRVKLATTELFEDCHGAREDEDMLNMYFGFLMDKLNEPTDYVICPSCLPSCPHPREHMRAVRQFSMYDDKELKEFTRELDAWEDFTKGRSLLAMSSIAWEHFIDRNIKATSALPSTRTLFPAGDAHTALMFGPLLIENGVTKHPGGAFISLRNPPSLSLKPPNEIEEFLAEESDFQPVQYPDGSQEEKLFGTCYSVSPKRKVYRSQKPRRQRPWLSFRKQVLGGTFSGFTDEFGEMENLILQKFLEVAALWSAQNSVDNPQSQNRALLKACAQSVTELLEMAFGDDVRLHLLLFSERLLNRVKLQYSRVGNNCQKFCKAMLVNGDKWDSQFRDMYPTIPQCIQSTPETRCLRYLMSFAGIVSNPVPLGGKANIMATAIDVFDWMPHTDGADIIDHVASLRFKTDPGGDTPDLMMTDPCVHDELLLKSQSTCLFNLKAKRPCSLTTHLLDCPYDNLSVLTMHVHRSRHLYTFQSQNEDPGYETFLSTQGPKAWINNRLGVLFRNFLLHAYLRSMTTLFFTKLQPQTLYSDLSKSWRPQPTTWSRVRHDARREGNKIYMNDQDLSNTPGNVEGSTYPLLQSLLASAPFMQSEIVFNSRWKTVKSVLKAELRGDGKNNDTPWVNCDCRICYQALAILNCRRAKAHAEEIKERGETFNAGHPDYTPMETLQWSFARLQGHEDKNEAEEVLVTTPEYFAVA